MLTSFSEFKFYQSFRIPVEVADELRFLAEVTDNMGNSRYIDDAKLIDISVTGLGFSTIERISVGENLLISLQFKRMQLDLTGSVVRAFSDAVSDDEIIYGVELDEEKKLNNFLEKYIMSFSPDRLKECLIDSALCERYTKASDGLEMFSLLLSLFKDITHFGDREGFVDSMLEEVVRILNAQRASVFLINPETNELEAVAAMGVNKELLKFDYRLGIAGSVFTTGVALNIDVVHDKSRFNDSFDRHLNYETKSIICYPIHNREDKIIGVIEVLNKRNQDRFTVEDEKTMKVLTLLFSSVFHKYNPMSESSKIRRFSTPFDRENAIIGSDPHVAALRRTIIKVKDLDSPVLIEGERGVGKTLFANILHYEGQRGLQTFEVIQCRKHNLDVLEEELFGPNEEVCKLTRCQGGTILLKDIDQLSLEHQRQLCQILDQKSLPNSKISFDVRIIATSVIDLDEAVHRGTFEKDLLEYVSRSVIEIKPLRNRIDDIEDLVNYFLKVECKRQGLLFKSFSPKAMEKIKNYDWPRNIAELKTFIERIVLYNPKIHIITKAEIDDSQTATPLFDHKSKSKMFGDSPHACDHEIVLKDRVAIIEREMIMAEIKRHNGNKSQAAKAMGISREALRKKLIISQTVLDVLEKKVA